MKFFHGPERIKEARRLLHGNIKYPDAYIMIGYRTGEPNVTVDSNLNDDGIYQALTQLLEFMDAGNELPILHPNQLWPDKAKS